MALAPKSYLIGGDSFHKYFWPSLFVAFCMTHHSFAAWAPIAVVHQFWRQAYDFLLDSLMRSSHKMMWWSLFGLLSSSCCAVQLILNLFNFGCAGFNTYLGPLRPMFLALTITLQGRMWALALPNLGLPSTPDYFLPSIIASTVLSLFLSLLPEITELRNSRNSMTRMVNTADSGTLTEVVLSLEGLGCVACVSAIQGTLGKTSNNRILSNTVNLEKKEARITLDSTEGEARDSLVPDLINQIQAAGFEAALQSLSAGKPSGVTNGQDTGGVTNGQDSGGSGFITAILAGLLGSSCCILQLGVNILATLNIAHIGCAGFNKVLGPWRLHLRALTFVWLSYSWFGNLRAPACCRGSRGRLFFSTALCLTLTFLPELLRFSGGVAIAPPTAGAKIVKIKVDGMGCEACEAHVRGVLDRSSGVVSSRADFKGGFAEVEVAENWGFDVAAINRNLQADGYSATMADTIPIWS